MEIDFMFFEYVSWIVKESLTETKLFAWIEFTTSDSSLPCFLYSIEIGSYCIGYGDSGSNLRDRRLVRRFSFLIFDDVLNDNWDTRSNKYL